MIEIIVPHYKHECYLPDLIASFYQQDTKVWWLKIIQDDPDHKTFFVDHPNIMQFIHCEQNLGQAARFNQGIADSVFDWVGFMGADDMAMPWKISTLQNTINDARYIPDVVYTDAVQLNKSDTRQYIKSQPFDHKEIRQRNFIVASTVIVRRSFLEESGIYFNSVLFYGEDWHFYNQLAAAGAKFTYVPTPTVYYRDFTSNIGVRYGPEWQEQKSVVFNMIQELY